MVRLHRLGIRARPARTAALMQLAAELSRRHPTATTARQTPQP
jgi:hypothetical protein